MSKLETNQVDPSTGTTLTLGTSGDTIAIPSGVTIANSGTATGFGGANTPAFEAYLSASQTGIANNSSVKVQFNTEVFDTASAYDNSSNYRFTVPSGQAGKYFIYAGVQVEAGGGNSDLKEASCQIYKNGSVFRYNQTKFDNNFIKYHQIQNQATMDLSVGDYIEIYAHAKSNSASSSNIFNSGNKQTYFGGYKVIGA
tara:strand:+ start:15 stop:608 length:594 start_codon:yes stop_codon:yes gene_type:complete